MTATTDSKETAAGPPAPQTACWKAQVAAATVRLSSRGGQGVLVNGAFVLTAAHCIKWDGNAEMAHGGPYIEKVEAKSGAVFLLGVLFADPVADIAVLGMLDEQEFRQDCERFKEWRKATAAVPLSREFDEPCEEERELRIHVLTHLGRWISGSAPCSTVWSEHSGTTTWHDMAVEAGTSGSPVLDDSGRLVGVMSGGSDATGIFPVARHALARWVLDQIQEGENEQGAISRSGGLSSARSHRSSR